MTFQSRTPAVASTAHLPDLGVAVRSILGFWLLYMVLVTLKAVIADFPEFWPMFGRRVIATLAGASLTFVVYLALRTVATASLTRKTVIAALLCLPASALFATANFTIFYVFAPLEAAKMDLEKKPIEVMAPKAIAEGTLSWYFLFAAWAAFYVAMSYAAEVRAADRRAATFAREAQEAQLRALRYQINPHFLFNTLNSLSSLILSDRTCVAERMIMNLATFFRTTLSADTTADVPLDEEIRFQRLYLDIEQVRFPDRLQVEIDVPAALASARVPVLILQPIVENAIKYGVARSRAPVRLKISAFEEAGRLHLEVRDDSTAPPPGEEGRSGTGVGLKNVCDRLVTRYGASAGCFYGPDLAGGYAVRLILPVVRDGDG